MHMTCRPVALRTHQRSAREYLAELRAPYLVVDRVEHLRGFEVCNIAGGDAIADDGTREVDAVNCGHPSGAPPRGDFPHTSEMRYHPLQSDAHRGTAAYGSFQEGT